jgi:hypothetical protein
MKLQRKLVAATMTLVVAAMVLVAVAATAMAFASGVTTAGTGVDLVSGGGGGGGSTPAPARVLVPCAQIASFKSTGGTYQQYGAIWVSFNVKNCGPIEDLIVTVTETTDSVNELYGWAAGTVWERTLVLRQVKVGGNFSFGNLDNDFAIPGAWYHGTIKAQSVSDGPVLASQTIDTLTGCKVGV